jgi:hypothetical protein
MVKIDYVDYTDYIDATDATDDADYSGMPKNKRKRAIRITSSFVCFINDDCHAQ